VVHIQGQYRRRYVLEHCPSRYPTRDRRLPLVSIRSLQSISYCPSVLLYPHWQPAEIQKKNPYRPQESQMRSPRRSTRALSCAARRSALIRSTCSTHTPRARATFACSVSPRTTRLCTHPRPRVRELDDGCRPDGAAACYRTGMWCRRLCGARRVTSRSCARLCGMARSCRRMMTCGSHCVFRASLF